MSVIKNIAGYLLDWASGIANIPAALTALGSLKGEVGKIVEIAAVDESGIATGFEAVEKPNGDGSGEDVSQVEPAYGDIPMVFFGAPLQQTKTEAISQFWYYSKTLQSSGWAKIKAQGNSTMSFAKKNQTVKLFKDAACAEKLKIDFKGWGKQNKYVIKAYWRDLTHTRDVGSVRLESDCAKTRSDYEEMPELLRTSPNMGAVDGFPVLVYANGIYQGRYMWNIPKDAWMANMDDDLDEHCILCSENYSSGCFRATANIDGNDWTDEIHDTVPDSIKTRWNEVITFVQTATDEEFAANLDSYINVNSLIDRHIMGLYACDYDGYGKNQMYMTYDGQKWYAVPYDKDGTWGNYWTGNAMLPSDYGREEYEDFTSSDSSGQGNLLFIRLEALFYERLQTRWAELRDTVLSVPNTIHRLRELYDITPPDLIAEDYASTTAGGTFTGIPNTTTCTIQQIQQFVAERHLWMDEYIAGLTPEVSVPCTGISLDKDELTFTEAGSQTLAATVTPEGCTDPITWESDNISVATVSGGVVTAFANGSATITAKCGEHSASCSVAVSGSVYESLLYSLPQETTFDGTDDYIDTGIKLFESDSDFTIALEFTGDSNPVNMEAVFHCVKEESPWPGVALDVITAGNAAGYYRFYESIVTTIPNNSTDKHRVVVVKNAAAVTIKLYWDSSEKCLTNSVASVVSATHDMSLLLGAKQALDGTKQHFWGGSIHNCSVYNRAFTDDETAAYLNG